MCTNDVKEMFPAYQDLTLNRTRIEELQVKKIQKVIH